MKGGHKRVTNLKEVKELPNWKLLLFESMMSKVMKLKVPESAGKRTAKRAYRITQRLPQLYACPNLF